MTISKNNEITFIFLTLFFAVFNDLIRIPGTVASFFRIFLPFAFLLCLYRVKERKHYIAFLAALVIVDLLQNMFFTVGGLKPDLRIALKFFLLYLSIFVIFFMVRLLRRESQPAFLRLFFDFLPKVGLLNLVFYWLCETQLQSILGLANRNNYAVSLAAIFPFFFLKGMEDKRVYFVYCIFIIGSLFFVGSKAAFFGIVLEILLLVMMKILRSVPNGKLVGVSSFLAIFAISLAIVKSPIIVDRHPVSYYFSEMTNHILNSAPYSSVTSSYGSLRYRTNATIYMLGYIRESNFLGIGIGNTGRCLLQSMPKDWEQKYLERHPEVKKIDVLSPHNGLLEYLSDCGLWAFVFVFMILKTAIKKFLDAKNNDFVDSYYVAMVISFPVWCMSASGLYTIYYIFIMMACFYEWYQMKKELYRGV